MRKIINEYGHIILLSPTIGVEITDEEKNEILEKIKNIPKDTPKGYTYRLRNDNKEWELFECEIVEIGEPTETDYAEVGKILLGVNE